MKTKKQLERLVTQNQIIKALHELKEISKDEDVHIQILQLEARYRNLKRSRKLGTHEGGKLRMDENQIIQAIFELIPDVFEMEGIPDLESPGNQASPETTKPTTPRKQKLASRDLSYAVRYTLSNIFRRPAENGIIWLVILIGVALWLLSNFPEWIDKDPAFAARYKWPALWGLLILLLLLVGAKIQQLLQKTRQLKPFDTADSDQSPIKGLRSFDFEDAEIFKSLQRTDDVGVCLKGILQSDFRFGVLSGESGCGKTSFVRAGLHAALEEKEMACVVVKLSNESPLDSINKALSEQLKGMPDQARYTDLFSLLEFAVSKTPNGRLVLILDQFEQFFTHQKTVGERKGFIEHLRKCYLELSPVKILVSLRRDFTGRLHEIQKALAYLLQADYNYFDLEKFSPAQAAAIFQVMAEAENMAFDEVFIRQMCEEELASIEDRLISAADIQILAFIIKGRQSSDKAFTQTAFQKMGGIDGLLQRFLKKHLETPNYHNTDQAALKVLLAFIDLNNNVRVGGLNLVELNRKLADSRITPLLPAILNWLEDLRLITKTLPSNNEPIYELAHERLILPLNNLAGRTLGEVEEANQILNKRTNEWLAGKQKSRYLPSWREYRLIQRQQKRQLIRWGKNKERKEKLLQTTRRRFVRQFSAILLPLLLFFGWLGVQQTNWYIFNRKVPNTLANLIIENLSRTEQIKILDSLAFVHTDFAYATIGRLNDQTIKDRGYNQVIKVWTDSLALDSSQLIPTAAFEAAAQIESAYYQSSALRDIANAIAQLGDTTQAHTYLRQAGQAAAQIENESYQSKVLREIANAAAQLGDIGSLRQAGQAAAQIESTSYQSKALRDIAKAAAQLGDTGSLRQTGQAAAQIESMRDQSEALSYIAKVAAQLGDTTQAHTYLRQAGQVAAQIEDERYQSEALSYIAKVAAQLGDTTQAHTYLRQAGQAAAQIENAYSQFSSLCYIAKAAAQVDDTQSLRQVGQAVAQIENESYQSEVLRDIANAAVQLGDTQSLRQAGQAAAQIEDESYQSEALCYIANAAAQAGYITMANTYFQQAVQATAQIKDSYYQSDALSDIANVAAQVGYTALANTYLQQAVQAAAQIESIRLQPYTLRDIAKVATQLGDTTLANTYFQQAVQATAQIKDSYFQSDALSDIAKVAAQLGDTESLRQAGQVANQIEFAQPQSSALRDIVNAATQLGDTESLRQAGQVAAQIEDAYYQSKALSYIANATAQLGDTTQAHTYLRQAGQVAAQIEDADSQSSALRDIANAAAQAGDQSLIKEIEGLIPAINGLEYQAIALEALTAACLQFGKKRKGYQVAKGMLLSNTKMKALAYLNLMKAWGEEGKFEPISISRW